VFNLVCFSPTTIDLDPNRQLLLKLKKNEHGELTSSAMANENSSNNNLDDNQPHVTNMLSNLNDDNQWNDQPTTTTTTTVATRYRSIER